MSISPEIPREGKGRIRWRDLRQDPERLSAVIEHEASRFLETGLPLTQRNLFLAGFSYLTPAIMHYYPGGYRGLREKMGSPPVTTARPKSFWDQPEAIQKLREEARAIYQQKGTLSNSVLKEVGRNDLVSAISRHHPGGLRGLKQELGVASTGQARGYWTPENIKAEAKAFREKYHKLNTSALQQHGRADLVSAARKYPGGMRALKQELQEEDKQKPHGYWTPEAIRTEAREFQTLHGSLSQSALAENNRSDLIHAIWVKYPGGVRQLQQDLGLVVETRRPVGFWTPENIEAEVQEFYNRKGTLAGLRNDRNDLSVAIGKKYPGGMPALVAKLQLPLPPRVDRKTNIYVTEDGKSWSYSYILAQQFGINPSTMDGILKKSGITSIKGSTKSGRETVLYNIEEAKRFLKINYNRDIEADSKQTISSEEAFKRVMGI